MNIGLFWTGRIVGEENGKYYEMYEDEYGEVTLDAPCECYDPTGKHEGHFACSPAPADLVACEKAGELIRYWNGTSWRWAVLD